MGNFLGIVNIHRSMANLAEEDQKNRAFLQAGESFHIMSSPREDAQGHDIFISLTGGCPFCHCKLSKTQGQST